jgi:Domain of unknown function (DUF4148)
MKRHIVAIALGSLFALPAFATDGQIDHSWINAAPQSNLSREQVRADLVAAQRAGEVVVDGETGVTALQAKSIKQAGNTREEVLAQLMASKGSNPFGVDGEVGL